MCEQAQELREKIAQLEAALRAIRDQGVSGLGYQEIIRRVLGEG